MVDFQVKFSDNVRNVPVYCMDMVRRNRTESYSRTHSEKSFARSVDGRVEQQQQQQQQFSSEESFYTNGAHDANFKVDTFEYRLLREAEFREAVTRRSQVNNRHK